MTFQRSLKLNLGCHSPLWPSSEASTSEVGWRQSLAHACEKLHMRTVLWTLLQSRESFPINFSFPFLSVHQIEAHTCSQHHQGIHITIPINIAFTALVKYCNYQWSSFWCLFFYSKAYGSIMSNCVVLPQHTFQQHYRLLGSLKCNML